MYLSGMSTQTAQITFLLGNLSGETLKLKESVGT